MKVPVSFQTAYRRANKILLVDSGATDNFMDPRTVKYLKLGTQKLGEPRKIWNIDGTNNKARMITDFVDLSVQVNQEIAKMRFLITDLGIEDAILGYPWLARFKPNFGWKEGIIDNHRAIPQLGRTNQADHRSYSHGTHDGGRKRENRGGTTRGMCYYRLDSNQVSAGR